MTRLISKKQAIMYKTKRNTSQVALSLLYAIRQQKRISKEEFTRLEFATRAGRSFYTKKLKSLIK